MASAYKFPIHIDREDRELSQHSGIPFGKLGELLIALQAAIGDNYNATLVQIEDGSYAPTFETYDIHTKEKFAEVHTSLKQKDFGELNTATKDYATFLKNNLFREGYYIQAYERNEKEEENLIAEVKTILKESRTKNYFSVTTITGKIVGLDDPTEAKPFIRVKTNKGDIIKILINNIQEKSIKESSLYKEPNIRFKIRIKKFFSENISDEGTLIEFKVPSKNSFIKAIQNAKDKFGDVFKNVPDPSTSIKKLREGKL